MNKKLFVISLCVVAAIAFVWFVFTPRAQEYSSGANPSAVAQNGTYSSTAYSFSVRLPEGFVADTDYINQDLGPGREISGVGFHIPASFSTGTNLSPDSHLAVEVLHEVACTPEDFLDRPGAPVTQVLGSNTFAVSQQIGAAAGNIYDETVYITKKENRCYGVRYFIHSTNIGNYPAGAVREFDRAALIKAFDTFTASLVLY